LSEDLRKVLAMVDASPKYYPPPHDVEAISIVRDVLSDFTRLALEHEDESQVARVLEDVLWPEYQRGIMAAYYYLSRELKLEGYDAYVYIMDALRSLAGLKPSSSSPVHRVIVDTLVEIIDGGGIYAPYPLYLIEYAIELNLVYWDGEKWNLTELGRFMLKLPPLELIKALLTLEALLSRATPYCMTREFLEFLEKLLNSLPEDEASEWEIVDNYAEAMGLAPFMVHFWFNRLAKLGVITFKADQLSANEFTLQLLSLVLDPSSNPYYSLVSSLVFQSGPPLVTTNIPEHIEELESNPLVSGSWGEVRQALNSYGSGDYHAALRTLLPVIEKVLREIAVKEGLAGTDKGFSALVEIVKGSKLISARTEGLLKALGRDFELHGLEQLDLDRARFYAELALMTLLELVRDYERHKLLREALQEISRELGVSSEELIKAYPDNRRTIHVQFLSDRGLRITVKGQHVYEVVRDQRGRVVVSRVKPQKEGQP